jgi:chaperonin GroES
MTNELSKSELSKVILIGDRILIKSKTLQGKTKSGLYLPPNVQEKETVQTGYVIKAGPGIRFPQCTTMNHGSLKARP